MFQTFGYFFHFLHSFFYILDNIRYKFTRILTLTIQQGLSRDTIMWSAEPPPVFLCASVIACFVYLIIVQLKKNVPLGTLFLWEAGGICRCKDRHFSFIFQVFLPLHTKLFFQFSEWKNLFVSNIKVIIFGKHGRNPFFCHPDQAPLLCHLFGCKIWFLQ